MKARWVCSGCNEEAPCIITINIDSDIIDDPVSCPFVKGEEGNIASEICVWKERKTN